MNIKHKLQKKTQSDSAQALYTALAALNNAAEVQKFLQDLCTPAEIHAMMGRWQVVSDIKACKPYRQIYAETGVSVTTVGRVARCLEYGEGGYNLIYERLKRKESSKNIKKK